MFKFPKCFFGWDNFKWMITEMNKMYSGATDSFYSKKRIESGLAFIALQWGMIYYLLKHSEKMTMTDMLIWAGVEAGVAGYMINQIEKNNKAANEKTDTSNNSI